MEAQLGGFPRGDSMEGHFSDRNGFWNWIDFNKLQQAHLLKYALDAIAAGRFSQKRWLLRGFLLRPRELVENIIILEPIRTEADDIRGGIVVHLALLVAIPAQPVLGSVIRYDFSHAFLAALCAHINSSNASVDSIIPRNAKISHQFTFQKTRCHQHISKKIVA